MFLYRSDGVTTPERKDMNITEDMTLIAYFGYTLDYVVNGNVGGKMVGETHQGILPDGGSESVTAVADEGYVFCGWSDLSWETTREGDVINGEMQIRYYATWEIAAYFEPIEKTFTYDYGDGITPKERTITLNRNDIHSARFAVPEKEGYEFYGWYADEQYRTRVTDGKGKYMYGYAAFSLESDTLYARWLKNGEKFDPHKILLVLLDEIDCDVKSRTESYYGQIFRVRTKMTALHYDLFKWLADSFESCLSEWLDGIVDVEVDLYYTTNALTELYGNHPYYYGNPKTPSIPEIGTLDYSYHNTLTFFDYGELVSKLIAWTGIVGEKHGAISARNFRVLSGMKHKQLDLCKNGEQDDLAFSLHNNGTEHRVSARRKTSERRIKILGTT